MRKRIILKNELIASTTSKGVVLFHKAKRKEPYVTMFGKSKKITIQEAKQYLNLGLNVKLR